MISPYFPSHCNYPNTLYYSQFPAAVTETIYLHSWRWLLKQLWGLLPPPPYFGVVQYLSLCVIPLCIFFPFYLPNFHKYYWRPKGYLTYTPQNWKHPWIPSFTMSLMVLVIPGIVLWSPHTSIPGFNGTKHPYDLIWEQQVMVGGGLTSLPSDPSGNPGTSYLKYLPS